MLAQSEAGWDRALERERPRFAVLYEDNFNYLSKMCLLRMREAAFAMIRSARKAGCTVLVAGADATDHAEEYLAAGADYVLMGEGEVTLVELMDRLTGRTASPPREHPGLAFVDPADAERVVRTATPAGPAGSGLSALPRLGSGGHGRYREIWHRHHGYFSMNIVSSGDVRTTAAGARSRSGGSDTTLASPENVVAEMKSLQEKYRPDHLWFADDIFGLKPGWVQRFAEPGGARRGSGSRSRACSGRIWC